MKTLFVFLLMLTSICIGQVQLDYNSQIKNKATDTAVSGIKGGYIWNGAADPNSFILPPTVIQTSRFSSASNGVTNLAVTTGSSVTKDNLLIVSLSGNDSGYSNSLTDTLGTVYTKYKNTFYGKATSSGIDTITITVAYGWPGINGPSLMVTEFSNTQALLDTSNFDLNTHSLSVTTNYPGDLVYTSGWQSCTSGSVGVYTPGTGETLINVSLLSDVGGANMAEYKVSGSPGVVTSTTVGADAACTFLTTVLAFEAKTAPIGGNGDYYINTSTNTIFGPKASGLWPNTGIKLGGDVIHSYSVLADATTINWIVSSSTNNGIVTLGGNRALTITGATNGMSGTLIVKQDATGTRTLTLPTGSIVSGGGTGLITLSTAPSAVDVLYWRYDGINYYWTIGSNFN